MISLQKEGWWEDVCESGFHSPELDGDNFQYFKYISEQFF